MRESFIRIFEDDDGRRVTFLPASEVARLINSSPNTISRWARMDCIRTCSDRLKGQVWVSLVDAVRLKLTPASETLALGLRRMPPNVLRQCVLSKDKIQHRTQPAENGGDGWDDYDVTYVIGAVNAGTCIEEIAKKLGRTYLAVQTRIYILRQDGELETPEEDLTWLDQVQELLSKSEVELLEEVIA